MPTETHANRLAATWLETEAAWLATSIEAGLVLAVAGLKQVRRGIVILPAAHVIDLGVPITDVINAAGARPRVVGSVDALSADVLSEACRPGDLALFVMDASAKNVMSPAAFSWAARGAGARSLFLITSPDQAAGMGAAAFDLTIACTDEGLGIVGGSGDTIERLSQSVWARIVPAPPVAVTEALPGLKARADEAVLGGQPPDPMSESKLRKDTRFESHADGTLTPAATQRS